jgi:hypothetical protein
MKNKQGLKAVIASILFIPALFLSCSKTESDKPDAKAIVVVDNTATGTPVIIDNLIEKSYNVELLPGQEYFEWEDLLYLPLPEYSNVPMPWNEVANTSISDHFKTDIKKSDGWELYISNFSSILSPKLKMFILYNKYSGIMRMYYYLTVSGENYPFDYNKFKEYNVLSHSISTLGSHSSQSPLLNFDHQSIVDVNTFSKFSQTLEPKELTDFIWYAWEYELAFDKNVYDQNDQTFSIQTSFALSKLAAMTLNENKINDRLPAKIRISDFNNAIEAGSGYAGNVCLIINNKKDVEKISQIVSPSDLEQINQFSDNQSFDVILSGVSSSNSTGIVRWSADLGLVMAPNELDPPAGSYTTAVSGANNSEMEKLRPFYTKALGVFYLNAKPKVHFSRLAGKSFQYTLDAGSVEYLFNPSVLQIAEIQNIQQELVATEGIEIIDLDGRKELYRGQTLTSNKELHIQGVRVSFDVVPLNGDPTVHIVKMFKAEIVNENQ